MNQKHRTLHLILSSSVAVAFIVSSYVLSGPFSFRPSTADAASAEALLKSYASKDSDADGLPDWQESLYGTDPANPESFQAGIKDGDAVAQGLIKPKLAGAGTPTDTSGAGRIEGSVEDNTVTAQFARQFFTSYFNKYGNFTALTDEQLSAFTQEEVQKLIDTTNTKDTYTISQIAVSGTGNTAIRSYLSRTDTSLNTFSFAKEKDELLYMEDAILRNDTSALAKVQGVGKVYTNMSKALVKIQVPTEVGASHLRIVNALATLGSVTTDMGTSDTDPVRSLMGLMRYQSATDEVTMSLKQLYGVLSTSGTMPTEGERGFEFYSVAKLAHDTEVPAP